MLIKIVLGFIIFFSAIMIMGDLVLGISKLLRSYPEPDYYFKSLFYMPKIIGAPISEYLISSLKKILSFDPEANIVKKLGLAIFFATQAHHYLIDRYLWRKEKDYAHFLRTNHK